MKNSSVCANICSRSQILQIYRSLLQDDHTLIFDPKYLDKDNLGPIEQFGRVKY